MPVRRMLAPLLLLAATLACGGGGSTSWGGASTGTLTVRFGTDSFPGYDQAVVSLEKLEGTTNGTSWTTLGMVQATYDLMALQNGNSVKILPTATVPAGTYSQFRITWALINYSDQSRQAAYVVLPGATTGLLMSMPATTVIPASVTVSSGGSATAQIMLSGQQAVQPRASTPSYTFQATGRAFDLSQTATISGTLSETLANGSAPLIGAEVYAETVDGLGVATIQRRAFTNSSGSYALDCLPATSSTAYFVVAQPGDSASAYPAEVSAPINVTANPSPINLTFSGAVQPGALTLTITPPSTSIQATWGELRQGLSPAPGLSYQFIVRSQGAFTGALQDQVYFTGLAPSYYGVTAERSLAGATPTMAVYSGQIQVSSGLIPASVTVAF